MGSSVVCIRERLDPRALDRVRTGYGPVRVLCGRADAVETFSFAHVMTHMWHAKTLPLCSRCHDVFDELTTGEVG